MSNDIIINNNVILIGFMATGKSSVGKMLATRLKMGFIDTDQMIVERYNKSIDTIFNTVGEEVFRDYEHKIIEELAGIKNSVISVGGGAIAYRSNLNILSNLGFTISLIASADTILKRIKSDNIIRPLISDKIDPKEQILALLQKRAYYYIKSDLLIDTDLMLVEQVVDHIYEVIYAKKNHSKNK